MVVGSGEEITNTKIIGIQKIPENSLDLGKVLVCAHFRTLSHTCVGVGAAHLV